MTWNILYHIKFHRTTLKLFLVQLDQKEVITTIPQQRNLKHLTKNF